MNNWKDDFIRKVVLNSDLEDISEKDMDRVKVFITSLLEKQKKEMVEEIRKIDSKTFMEGLTAEQWQGANTMQGYILNLLSKLKQIES